MKVKDAEMIRRIMESKGISARKMAEQMGWSSHSYMNRILSGQARTVTPDTAMKLAYHLQVPVDLLFVTRASGDSGRNVKGGRVA